MQSLDPDQSDAGDRASFGFGSLSEGSTIPCTIKENPTTSRKRVIFVRSIVKNGPNILKSTSIVKLTQTFGQRSSHADLGYKRPKTKARSTPKAQKK